MGPTVNLRIKSGAHTGKVIPVAENTFVIGRERDCNLKVNVPGVSRYHCRLELIDQRLYVSDLRSRNGTYVNETRVETRQELVNGDNLRIDNETTLGLLAHVLEGLPRPPQPPEGLIEALDELLESLTTLQERDSAASDVSVTLRVMNGEQAGDEIGVAGEMFLIGRAKECRWRPAAESTSRRHCTIRIRGDHVAVEDLNSSHGTFVNGERISTPHTLADGDQLRLGELELTVMIRMGEFDSTATVPDVQAITNFAASEGETQLDASWQAELESEIEKSSPNAKQVYMPLGSESEGSEPEGSEPENDALSEDSNDEALEATKADNEPTKVTSSKKNTTGKLPVEEIDTKDAAEAAKGSIEKLFGRR